MRSTSSELRGRLRRPPTWLLLALILGWALTLRLFFGLRPVGGFADYDERYNLANVTRVVVHGEWQHENAYYSYLSWVPQAAIAAGLEKLSTITGRDSLSLYHRGKPSRRSIYLFRTMQALYGVALVWVVFLLGRELSGEVAGLLAAALLSSSRMFVWGGAWFKPDALAALTTMLALLWAVRAIESPARRRLVAAGVGVGLATSAKLTSVLSAIPLALAAPIVARRSLRRWADFVLAAVASLAVFLLTAPAWQSNIHYAGMVTRDYAWRAEAAGESYFGVLQSLFGELLPSLHGRLWAGLFWLGVFALVVPAWTRRLAPQRLLALRVVAATTILYPIAALVLVGAPFLRSNNVLPILPAATVVASAFAVDLWRLSGSFAIRLGRPFLAWLAALAVVVPSMATGTREIYAKVVPTTEDRAFTLLRKRLALAKSSVGPRVVFLEPLDDSGLAWDGSGRSGSATSSFVHVDSLDEIGGERLDRADAELFRIKRLRGARRSLYEERLQAARDDGAIEAIESRWAQARGPDLVAILHPWVAAARLSLEIEATTDGWASGTMPAEIEEGELVSLLVLPRTNRHAPETLTVDGAPVQLHRSVASGSGRRYLYLTERFVARGGALVRFSLPAGANVDTTPLRVDLWRWRQRGPEAFAGPSSAAAEAEDDGGDDPAGEELDREP